MAMGRTIHPWILVAAIAATGCSTSTPTAVVLDGGSDASAAPSTSPDTSDAATERDGSTRVGDASTPQKWKSVSLNFDDIADGPIGTRYSDVAKFVASAGDDVFAYDVPVGCGQSMPNILVSGAGPGVGDGDLRIEFVRRVRKLRFHALGVNDTGTVAELRFYRDGALVESTPLTGKGTYFIPVPLDFTSVGEIDTFEVTNVTDAYGLMWDDFEFEMVEP